MDASGAHPGRTCLQTTPCRRLLSLSPGSKDAHRRGGAQRAGGSRGVRTPEQTQLHRDTNGEATDASLAGHTGPCRRQPGGGCADWPGRMQGTLGGCGDTAGGVGTLGGRGDTAGGVGDSGRARGTLGGQQGLTDQTDTHSLWKPMVCKYRDDIPGTFHGSLK